ncbi:MAG: sodium:alanine symporter family protein [Bacteroidales bacterium]|nr:sodium:alanine symporter family protein [Candidatus Equibacterium intestinale]
MIQFLHEFNNYLYAYVLIVILIGCGLYFTIRTRVVQMRLFKESCRMLVKSNDGHSDKKHISNFQAFALAVASRVGVGNIAGVAIAMTIGGPGAIFWMWIAAMLGAATGYVEAVLAQCYKREDETAFIILFSGIDLTGGVTGIELAQQALESQLGPVGSIFITIALAFFVFSTLITFYYYGEANLKFCTQKKWAVPVFKILVLAGIKDPVLKKWWK